MQNADTNSDEINLMPNAVALSDSWRTERADRIGRKDKLMTYGVSFLDDCFTGIANDDLIIIGAGTGVGKTQLALQIAVSAAKNNKKVLFFALESTKFELARRIKFAFFYNELKEKYGRARFSDWVNGLIVEQEDRLSDTWMENITQVFRLDNFGVKELRKYILAEKLNCDLIVLDHLHYLDLPGENDNREVRDAVKEIRSISLDIGKPIVVISHLRKRDKFDQTPWPKLDDFHGSSEISKMATQAFSLCVASVEIKVDSKINNMPIKNSIQTKASVLTILKNRADGAVVGSQAAMQFDIREREYQKNYKIIKWDHAKKILIEETGKPDWAQSATNGWD